MGVNGLLPFLKKCSRRVDIKDFKGYTVAVDTYCWVHRASYSCAMDIALGNPTSQYLKMVLDAGVRPILVFDGADLPAKAETEAKRRRSRKMYRERAAQYLLEGKRKAAQECFERCVEVTAEMARAVMKAARKLGVDCIIAPYESDAQLAYLVQSGYADLVITEDSDLLMFGCKQVIFKLDLTGFGTLITWSAGIGEQCCGIASQDFSPANLRFMGILSGCDYFPGIPRIGLATAAKIMRQCRTTDFRYLLSNLGNFYNLAGNACQPIQSLNEVCLSQSASISRDRVTSSPLASISTPKLSSTSSNNGKFSVEGWKSGGNRLHEATILAAMRAERTFRLQVVFDPKTRKRLRLSEPTIDDIKEERLALLNADLSDDVLFSYAGEDAMDSELAFAIAVGNVDFETGEKVDTFNPDHFKVNKLFNGLSADSDEPQEIPKFSCAAASSLKSILKRARRPDGERLNISVWSTNYKLEPVWLYYTDAGIRPRPFCISVDDHANDSQRLDLLQLSGGVEEGTAGVNIGIFPKYDNLPRFRPKLRSGKGLSRNHRVIVPSVLTSGSATTNAQKRPLDEDAGYGPTKIQGILASYASEDSHVLPRTPLRSFSTSGTPITSANSYFASPVSTAISTGDYGAAGGNPSSPVFQSKRSKSLSTVIEPEFVSIEHVHRSASTFRRTPHKKSAMSSALTQRLLPSLWKSTGELPTPLRQLSNGQQQQSLTDEGLIEHRGCEPSSSPIYDGQTVGFEQVDAVQTEVGVSPIEGSKRSGGEPELSSFFSKWQFTPPRSSIT
ncbi:Exonuclease [Echinococcus granulosus]|uniref:Exonuclease 1 n=1 Tax=Echinococcus granulosus TaxID=6210 RepID=W6UZK1_ECHGR|nr:Exonuclease [Echinococcus granulosus]EUB59094.1 Exonuclease [Echinococcus granulosus]